MKHIRKKQIGKRKQITKSGFKTKNAAFVAGQKAYDEFINGVTDIECNMLYGDYLDYWMKEYFEINYKYSTAKRYNMCAFLTACYTGMRTGKVCALTCDDIDFEKETINIQHNVYDKPKQDI